MAVTTVRGLQLALALRNLRRAADLTLDQVAGATDVDKTTLSRYEKGVRLPQPPIVRALLNHYGAEEDEIRGLVGIAKAARKPGWWLDYSEVLPSAHLGVVALESEASRIVTAVTGVVPGLLQTADYARETFAAVVPALSAQEIGGRLEARLRRQERLARGEVELSVLLDECVLQRAVGGVKVMRTQLERLLELGALSNVTLQIVPQTVGAYAGLPGVVTLLSYDGVPGFAGIAVAETPLGDVLMDQPGEIERCRAILDAVCTQALPPSQSRATVESVLAGT